MTQNTIIQNAYVITGSSSGIGAALSRRLAGPGTGIIVHARHNRDGAEAVAEQIREKGGAAQVVMGDLAEEHNAARVVETAVSEFGRIDGLVANAGIPVLKNLEEGSRADLDYAFGTNLFSFFELCQAARPHLTKAPEPRIVAVGSFTAYLFRNDMPSFPLSSASKGALDTMVRSLSLELATDKITVNCVSPGYVEKDEGTGDSVAVARRAEIAGKIPLGRFGKPDEIASTIAYLLSPQARYITGQTIHVNGGLV